MSSKFLFQLYISAGSPGSELALRNLKLICDALGEGTYEIEVINVRDEPQRAERARVLAVPTLIKQSPLPVLRVIGDLGEQGRILEALGHPTLVPQYAVSGR